MSNKKFDFLSWFLLIILSVIWGTSFILIKKGLVSFSPPQVASLRIAISFIAMTPFIFKYLKKIPKKGIGIFIIMAILGNGIPPFLYAIAQTKINSSIAGILNALTPLFTLVIGILLFSTRSSPLKVIGVFIGLAGALALILFQNTDAGGFVFMELKMSAYNELALLIVLATIFYGISVNILKVYFQNTEPISITTLIFLLIGPPAIVYLFSTDFITVMKTDAHAVESLIYIIILAVLGTSMATVLFFRLVQRTNALFGSTVTYLIPIIAVMWGIFDGEPFGLIGIVGLLLILTGVYLAGER